jgi:hypothetical protein
MNLEEIKILLFTYKSEVQEGKCGQHYTENCVMFILEKDFKVIDPVSCVIEKM